MEGGLRRFALVNSNSESLCHFLAFKVDEQVDTLGSPANRSILKTSIGCEEDVKVFRKRNGVYNK